MICNKSRQSSAAGREESESHAVRHLRGNLSSSRFRCSHCSDQGRNLLSEKLIASYSLEVFLSMVAWLQQKILNQNIKMSTATASGVSHVDVPEA